MRALFMLFTVFMYSQQPIIEVQIEPLFGAPFYGEAYWYRSNDVVVNNNNSTTIIDIETPASMSRLVFKPMTRDELDSLAVKVLTKYNAVKTKKQ